jgi:hypothetical protein
MGMETPGVSPENSFADLSEVDVKRRTGEFEPPDEISIGRLLNNIIVFEVHSQSFRLIAGIREGSHCVGSV